MSMTAAQRQLLRTTVYDTLHQAISRAFTLWPNKLVPKKSPANEQAFGPNPTRRRDGDSSCF
jgi:hypothetical protein